MPTHSDDDRKRPDPYDPRTGATGDSEPDEADDDADLDEDTDEIGDGEELGG